MAYDIKMYKLVNGDMVLGKVEPGADKITEVAAIQTVPTQQGVQMLLLPFGYPFEQDMKGEIELRHAVYEYKSIPEEIKTKYLEAATNLTLSAPGGLGGGLGGLDLKGGPGGKAAPGNIGDLFKK